MAHRHLLTPAHRTDDVTAITESVLALHSSDPATVYLSALARMANPSVAAIESALYDDRTIVRHHAMRRTIWVMTPDTARLAHGAATRKIAAAERKRTLKAVTHPDNAEVFNEAAKGAVEFADDPMAAAEAWFSAATAEIAALVEKQPQNTRSLGRQLPHLAVPMIYGAGTKNPATLKAHTKIVQGAGFDGVLVRGRPSGSWISAEYEWSTAEAWLGSPLTGMEEKAAAGPLLHRWLERFGPGTFTDITWWFGWTAGLARHALAECDATAVMLESGEDAWVANGDDHDVDDPGPWLQLLPSLDPTTMGWKERDWYLDPAHTKDLFDQFGNAGPLIVADGRVVGAWSHRLDGEIATNLTCELDASHRDQLKEAAERLAGEVTVVIKPRFPSPWSRALQKV